MAPIQPQWSFAQEDGTTQSPSLAEDGRDYGKQTDQELLGQFLATQDQHAFGQLVERYHQPVMLACHKQLGTNSSLVEDAVQNTFVLLAEKAPTLSTYDSLGGWLVQSAKFTAANLRRREQRRSHATFEPEVHDSSTPCGHKDFEVNESLQQLLATLPEKTKQAVVWHHLEGKPQKDVANLLGCSVEAAKKRIQFGVRKMRQHAQARRATFAGLLAMLLLPRRGNAASWLKPVAALGTAAVATALLLPEEEKPTKIVAAATSESQSVQTDAVNNTGTIGQLGPFLWSRAENIDERGAIENFGDALSVQLHGSTFFKENQHEKNQVHTRNTLMASSNQYHFTWQPQRFDFGTSGNHDMKVLIGYMERPEDGTALFTHGDNRDLMHRAPAARIAVFLPFRHGGRDPSKPEHYHVNTSYNTQTPCVIELPAHGAMQDNWQVPFKSDPRVLCDLTPYFAERPNFQPGLTQPLFDFRIGANGSWRLAIEYDGRDGLAGGESEHGWDTIITHNSVDAKASTISMQPNDAAWAMSVINPGGKPLAAADLESFLFATDRLTGEPLSWDQINVEPTLLQTSLAENMARQPAPKAWSLPHTDG